MLYTPQTLRSDGLILKLAYTVPIRIPRLTVPFGRERRRVHYR